MNCADTHAYARRIRSEAVQMVARARASHLGGALSMGLVPSELRTAYGSRTNLGLAVYVTVRPAARGM